jgi:hypothetical protein
MMDAFNDLLERADNAPSGRAILREIIDVARLLLDKNARYGDSALEPVRVMSDADAVEQIDVRIDDKLSRLASDVDDPEDVLLDLVGYIILRRVQRRGDR